MKKLFILMMILFSQSVFAEYDVIDRFKLTEDRFNTVKLLRPFGHDFLFDLHLAYNVKLKELVDDASTIGEGGQTESEKEAEANALFQKYVNNELSAHFGLNVGIPLPTFHAWGVKVQPDFRVSADFGTKIAVRSELLTVSSLIELLGNELSEQQRSDITAKGDGAIDDINTNHGGDVTAYLLAEDIITQQEADALGVRPLPSADLPNLFGFVKGDVKAGLLFNLSKDAWFGSVNLYGMARMDYFKRFTANDIAKDRGVGDGFDTTNEQMFVVTDLMLGYKFLDIYRVSGSIDELKVTTMSDKISEAGDLNYQIKPLLRLHADASFKYMVFTLNPFVGVHKREGYGVSDGIYAGTDFWTTTWGDRLGVRLRAMADTEHLTFSPLVKLWLMQLEYSLKVPITSEVDENMKVATFHSLDFRLFF